MIFKRRTIERFADIWMTDDGNKVRMQIMDAPDISQEADFQPKRIAVVSKKSPVAAGAVVSRGEDMFLLVDQSTLSDHVRYRALQITDVLRWSRNNIQIDEVSRMETDMGLKTIQDSLPVVIEPLRHIKEGGIERVKRLIYTGSQVKVGDFIGPYEVHLVQPFLGAYHLEAY